MPLSIVIVGNTGGTNVGDSFHRAATTLGHKVTFVDAARAFVAPKWVSRLTWRLWGHRPPRLDETSQYIRQICQQQRPDILVAAGSVPLVANDIKAISELGVITTVFLTDDPWNPTSGSRWFLKALCSYDKVFTPRSATLKDLESIGCRTIFYLPFAYDPDLFYPVVDITEKNNVVFIGGADEERVSMLTPLIESNTPVVLYGDYWKRYSITRPFAKGHITPQQLRTVTSSAHVNVCLVRRANRDGHVMRTFEIPACRGSMLAEDTPEHRSLLGNHVLYFRNEHELVSQCLWLLAHHKEKDDMAHGLYQYISTGKNTYEDRLMSILS